MEWVWAPGFPAGDKGPFGVPKDALGSKGYRTWPKSLKLQEDPALEALKRSQWWRKGVQMEPDEGPAKWDPKGDPRKSFGSTRLPVPQHPLGFSPSF